MVDSHKKDFKHPMFSAINRYQCRKGKKKSNSYVTSGGPLRRHGSRPNPCEVYVSSPLMTLFVRDLRELSHANYLCEHLAFPRGPQLIMPVDKHFSSGSKTQILSLIWTINSQILTIQFPLGGPKGH
ncbi:hypothetical protein GOBAR_DD35400 [Gossypium barbadense]|nr:hypothetical protein GOBAR_DD35400 [Gossypium barbadense]